MGEEQKDRLNHACFGEGVKLNKETLKRGAQRLFLDKRDKRHDDLVQDHGGEVDAHAGKVADQSGDEAGTLRT